jgi:hypothetical protein
MSSVDGEVLGVSDVKIGDLLVYYENEKKEQAWQRIPSGDELFTTYKMGLGSVTGGISYKLYDGNGDIVNNSKALELIGDDKSISVILNKDETVSIKHKEITVTTESIEDVEKEKITAITGITTDENGHITGYKT